MPYIKREQREELSDPHANQFPRNAGELNFAFSAFADKYIEGRGLNYQNINDVIGALEGAKMEFYRRVVAPYEDKKAIENGEVFMMAPQSKEGTADDSEEDLP